MKSAKLSDEEKVAAYMRELQHPLLAEINRLRTILLHSNALLKERIKWNSPSYYYKTDMAAFHLRETRHVHLVFVFPPGTMIHESNGLLQGDYKDRRMAYFYSMEDIEAKKDALEKVVNEWVQLAENFDSDSI